MVNQSNHNKFLSMSLDPHKNSILLESSKPPNLAIVTMDPTINTNSLKHANNTQFDYKHSKNKHLSQQIHKKKKNRNKQTHYKRKKLLKSHKDAKNTNKSPSKKHIKRPKLKKNSLSNRSSLNPTEFDNDEFYDLQYISKHNAMTEKHKKIQVINNGDAPYYLHTSSMSTKALKTYNYKKKELDHCPHSHHGIVWMSSSSPPMMKCSPSPMLLPTTLLHTNPTQKSPFLLPMNHLKHSLSPASSSGHISQTMTSHIAHGGEMLMGFESENANLIFGCLSELKPLNSQQSKISVISDYRYEGLQSHRSPDRIDDDLMYCVKLMRAIKHRAHNLNGNALSIDKLTEIGDIVNELKDKMHVGTDCALSDQSEDKHEETHDDGDEVDDDHSNESMISGVELKEKVTPNGSTEFVYYD